jgi:hypothetical protein
MSMGGRAGTRARILRRALLIAGVLVLLALLFLVSGHLIVGILFLAAGAVAIWAYLQARRVR